MLPSYVEIGPPVPEKKILKGFYHGRGGNLGHVASIMSSDLYFLVPESFHTIFGSDRHEFLRKSNLILILGKVQEMILTFNTHIYSYIQLEVCSYYLSGHWQQLFLKNPLLSLFPTEKA